MSTTTVTLTNLVAGTTNDPAPVNANFNAIKTMLETTGLGAGNLKAKFYKHSFDMIESTGVPNATNGIVARWKIPAGFDFDIGGVSVGVEAKTGNPTVTIQVDTGAGFNAVAGPQLITDVAGTTIYEFSASPTIVNSGDTIAINWSGAAVTGVDGVAIIIFGKYILQES